MVINEKLFTELKNDHAEKKKSLELKVKKSEDKVLEALHQVRDLTDRLTENNRKRDEIEQMKREIEKRLQSSSEIRNQLEADIEYLRERNDELEQLLTKQGQQQKKSEREFEESQQMIKQQEQEIIRILHLNQEQDNQIRQLLEQNELENSRIQEQKRKEEYGDYIRGQLEKIKGELLTARYDEVEKLDQCFNEVLVSKQQVNPHDQFIGLHRSYHSNKRNTSSLSRTKPEREITNSSLSSSQMNAYNHLPSQ